MYYYAYSEAMSRNTRENINSVQDLRYVNTGNEGDTVATTTTIVHVEPGTVFWLMLFVLIVGIVMWAKLGSEEMNAWYS